MKYPEIILRTFATPVVFVLIAIGFHFFLRGHNAPGGGFIAGLIVAVSALLMRIAQERRLLNVSPQRLVPLGLLVAFATGAAPLLFGQPFLRSAYGYLELPFAGEVEWATAALFDLGVFLVVIGTTLTIINLLAETRDEPEPLEDPPAGDSGAAGGPG